MWGEMFFVPLLHVCNNDPDVFDTIGTPKEFKAEQILICAFGNSIVSTIARFDTI